MRRNLSLVDYQLSQSGRWSKVMLMAAPVVLGSVLIYWLIAEINEIPADIAARRHLAPGTVRNYLSNAMQKTQTQTRHEAARYAREPDWL